MHKAIKKELPKAGGDAVRCCNGDCNQGRACPVRLSRTAAPAAKVGLLARIFNTFKAQRDQAQSITREGVVQHVGDDLALPHQKRKKGVSA